MDAVQPDSFSTAAHRKDRFPPPRSGVGAPGFPGRPDGRGGLMAATTLASPEPAEPSRRRSKKRPNGQGSVYQRKDGRWAAAAFVLGADGTYRRVPVYGSSAEDVDSKLTPPKARANLGLPTEATGWTVTTYGEDWLAPVVRTERRAPPPARDHSKLRL